MANQATGARQSAASSKVPAAALSPNAGISSGKSVSKTSAPEPQSDSDVRRSGYGLPCAKCRLYYPADLDACPTCHHSERVAAVVPKIPPKAARNTPDPVPDGATVEKEREEFLRQFKSHLTEANGEAGKTSGAVCVFGEHEAGENAGAVICQACFERVQERLDLCEAAFLIDSTEAAQIIYEAVWADPSDPGKTYENAANALLSELRKRAGVNSLVSPFQPLPTDDGLTLD
jgi:hypothetical protein